MIRPVDLLIQYLAERFERGETHVQLDAESRAWLKRKPTASPEVLAADAPQRPNLAKRQAAKASAKPASLRPMSPVSKVLSPELEQIRHELAQCAALQRLGSLREILVFSTGNPKAQLMLVGEAPGDEDEQRGEPFSGEAGDKLNDILKAMGLKRDEVYLTTIVKFRPRMARQTFANRRASAEEIAASLPFLRAEIDAVKPRCIVGLGSSVGQALLATELSIEALRAQWHHFHEIPTRLTHHPSYLLQSGVDHRIKRELWEDMLAVMELLERPISAKQRSYFLPKKA